MKTTASAPGKKPPSARKKPGPAGKRSEAGAGEVVSGFVVDDSFRVREFVGDTAPLLDIVPGDASLELRKLLSPNLEPGLRAAVEKARNEGRALQIPGPRVRIGGRSVHVGFDVAPIPGRARQWKALVRYPRDPGWEVPEPPRKGRPKTGERLRAEFRSLLDEEDHQHSRLLAQLDASQAEVDDTQAALEAANADLESANAQLEETNSQLRAALEERDEVERRLRESEAVSRELIETAAEGIIAADRTERIVLVNRTACEMFGYGAKELLGKKLSVLVPPGFKKAHSRDVAGYFENPARRPMGSGRHLQAIRKDGTLFPVDVGLSVFERGGEPISVAFVSDITERRGSELQRAYRKQQLRSLTNRLIAVGEEETRKWARELHDVYSQRLVGIAMELGEIAAERNDSGSLGRVESEVRRLAEEIHGLSRRMHPNVLHDLGLAAAARAELAAFEREHKMPTAFQTRNVPKDLSDDVSLCLYRILQEALLNIRKHSRAQHVAVRIEGSGDALKMTVEDRGDGFELAAAARRGGLGLISMEERASAVDGEFSIESSPGKGTTVRVRVPLPRGDSA